MPLETEFTDTEIDAVIERNLNVGSICRSVPDQARRIGVSKSFLFDEIRIGAIASFKIGRRRLIADADVAQYLAAHREQVA